MIFYGWAHTHLNTVPVFEWKLSSINDFKDCSWFISLNKWQVRLSIEYDLVQCVQLTRSNLRFQQKWQQMIRKIVSKVFWEREKESERVFFQWFRCVYRIWWKWAWKLLSVSIGFGNKVEEPILMIFQHNLCNFRFNIFRWAIFYKPIFAFRSP